MTHKTLFISDLHLSAAHPETTAIFFRFLNEADEHTDAIYILGDLVESWIGDDDNDPFCTAFKQALKTLSDRGIPLYFQHGNRDFLMGKQFSQDTGCTLLPEEHKINLYGTPVLLMHGDTLCTTDVAYLRARRFAYSKILRFLYLSLPLSLRRRIAEHFRNVSKKHTSTAPKMILDVTQSAVEATMKKHGVLHLIHGHTHQPATHTFSLNEKTATRHVLAAWHDGGEVLSWDETGQITVYKLKG
ncbi:MAG TPA: UDP-2,3-diacylglucosamine diphosphatase [Gammaproteobacteria bacterium]|nr:UDP-2,3-diacylglucosamine diphosphatase [Gammaproteobacteria bacterium]